MNKIYWGKNCINYCVLSEAETLIFISHRVSALIPCDEILIMDNGRIIDKGSHEELLKKNDIYRHTYEHQVLEKKLEDIS